MHGTLLAGPVAVDELPRRVLPQVVTSIAFINISKS